MMIRYVFYIGRSNISRDITPQNKTKRLSDNKSNSFCKKKRENEYIYNAE